MGAINNILLIIVATFGSLLPIMLFIFLDKKEKQSIPKQDTIKDYIKEYMKNYVDCQFVEIDSKILKNEQTQEIPNPFIMVAILFIVILIYSFKSILRINFFIGYLIGVIFVFGSLIVFLLTKKTSIKKISFKNNMINLYYSNDEIITYQLDQTNIKYNLLGNYGYKRHKYINIYFNDDTYTSNEYNIYNFEPYIAFVIFLNLLKRNELEKINSLNDSDIKILQNNFTYNEEK